MAQNGQNDHFGQNDLIPNRILVFARFWSILAQERSILVRLGPPIVLWPLLRMAVWHGDFFRGPQNSVWAFFVVFSWLFRGSHFGQSLRVLALDKSSDIPFNKCFCIKAPAPLQGFSTRGFLLPAPLGDPCCWRQGSTALPWRSWGSIGFPVLQRVSTCLGLTQRIFSGYF